MQRSPAHENRSQRLERTIDAVDDLRRQARRVESQRARRLEQLDPERRESGRNLSHYVAMRRRDLRELQLELHYLGLSSLGRMEAYVMASLDAVLHALRKLANRNEPPLEPAGVSFQQGRERLERHTQQLLGPAPEARNVRIMVTMPSEAADRPTLVHDLVAAGMDVMRINCAKDSPNRWRRMIEHLRQAERDTGRACRVMMDLAGPNPRTGPLETTEVDVEIDPPTDAEGNLVDSSRVWVTATGVAARDAESVLPVDQSLLEQMRVGDRIEAPQSGSDHSTSLQVVDIEPGGAWADAWEASRIAVGSHLRLLRTGERAAVGQVAPLPAKVRERTFRVRPGDVLIITRHGDGRGAVRNKSGDVVEPARVSCTLPQMLADVEVGDRVFYDDGDMEAVVEATDGGELRLHVVAARKGSTKIKSGKGLNFPDTETSLQSLTEDDIKHLDFVAEHADVVGFSFVRTPADVEKMLGELERRNARELGLVLKVETRSAFAHLPELLLTAMRAPATGVMVARGDMAAELGFERMSEVQEQILWLCEAAHVPVVWATDVLASLAKKGVPTRGDVTDAAMSGRAECVMLNKGEHICEAVEFLTDVLNRMDAHQQKKFAKLRALSVCGGKEEDAADA